MPGYSTNPDRKLSPRLCEVLRLIDSLTVGGDGVAPSLMELADAMSPPIHHISAREMVFTLKARGLVTSTFGVCRSWRLTPRGRAVLAEIAGASQ